jgi:hypothetical protein
MDEMIWVEVLSRHRDVVARHRCTGAEIRVGRGYANDVIIDDPHVAAEHLVIRRGEGDALLAETVNGADAFFDERDKRGATSLLLDGDRVLRIGHTLLRVRDASYTVPRERPYTPRRRHWPVIIALAIALLGLTALSTWLESVAEPKVTAFLQPPLWLSLFILGWSATWSVLARIFGGQAQFERNVIIALGGILGFTLVGMIAAGVGYSLSWGFISTYEYIPAWCAIGVICFLHLRAIGRARLWLKGGIVLAFLAVAIAMQTLAQSELRGGPAQQAYAHRLLPPALRLSPPQSEAAFFIDIERLKAQLDRDRAKDSTRSGQDDDDD